MHVKNIRLVDLPQNDCPRIECLLCDTYIHISALKCKFNSFEREKRIICPYFLQFNHFCFNYAILFVKVVSICNEKGQGDTETEG